MADGPFHREWQGVVGGANSIFDRALLKDFAPGEGVRAGAFEENFDEEGWIPIPVPGDVHRALLDAGRIEDPFYDRNEEKCAWIEDREWWYRITFDGPEAPRLSTSGCASSSTASTPSPLSTSTARNSEIIPTCSARQSSTPRIS